MEEKDITAMIKELGSRLPKFEDGRINYSSSDIAPVVSVFIAYDGKFLLLKRSSKVQHYKGLWDTVSGYIDELKPIKTKALEEVWEETGIGTDLIREVKTAAPYTLQDHNLGRSWVICPVLVVLSSKPDILLDFENDECRWVSPEEIKNYATVPDLAAGLNIVLGISSSL